MTAARAGEALGAKWSEIDLDAKVWTIPASRMKAGLEHRIPLPARAISIIEKMAAIRSCDFIFPGQALTNRQKAPTERGGKIRASAVLAAWLAACRDYRGILAPVERGQVQILATTRDTAANLFNFVCGAFEASLTRGSTAIAIICDELRIRLP